MLLFAEIKLETAEAESNARFIVHTTQLSAQECYRTHESHKVGNACFSLSFALPSYGIDLGVGVFCVHLFSARQQNAIIEEICPSLV